jgi:hypothetical protein
MTTSKNDPQFYTIFDRGRQLDFEGYHLANASSHVPGKPRWFVVNIYKTLGGKYIVAGSGQTNVVHRERCAQMKEKHPVLAKSSASSIPCEVCKPDLKEKVAHEINVEWAQVSDNPQMIIDRLRLRDSEGGWYIPKISNAVLMEAAEKDDGIKAVFYAPQRIK